MKRKTFQKGLVPWDEFGEACILGCYGEIDGESIANKKVNISPHRTITQSQQLGKHLESENIQNLTDLQVFDAMDELRKINQTA